MSIALADMQDPDSNDPHGKVPPARIRWHNADEEAGEPASPITRSQNRNIDPDAISIRSIHSKGRRDSNVDPGTVLPIQYRTVSFNINESTEQHRAELYKAKDRTTGEISNLDWHTVPINEVYQRLSSSPTQGLSVEQVQRKLKEHGKNIPSPPSSHHVKQILGYFFKGFGSILLVGSILVFVAWKPLGQPPALANLALAIVLLAVFFIQAIFNAWQDWSSSRVMASITHMLPEDCHVIRDGRPEILPVAEIVPGDILTIKAGNKLPADVRFFEVSSDAKFDRSILTGESAPLPGNVVSSDDNYLETRCIGMQGTHCVSGTALGVVVATGDTTVFGRIANLTNEPKTGLSTLEKEILRFVIIIVSIMTSMIVVVIIVWASWLRRDYPDWINVPTLIVDCVSVAIAFIPEGLPIALTASLTITANLMRKNMILCKSLKTVETLGAVSVICSDKTGTLTKNAMAVVECCIGTRMMNPEAARWLMMETRRRLTGENHGAVDQIHAVSSLCNAGEFEMDSPDVPLAERRIHGDATDQAILRFAEGLGPVSNVRNHWKKHFEIAFNSKNKFMLRTFSLVQQEGLTAALCKPEYDDWTSDSLLLTIKGAPDILINYCTHYVGSDGERYELDNAMRRQMEDTKDRWSSQGKRVILLARKIIGQSDIQSNPSDSRYESELAKRAKKDLTLIGLIGIVDPPRDEIPDVVRTLRGAGIRIFMVTGDFALTAQAIAAECGIISNTADRVDNVDALFSLDKPNEVHQVAPKDDSKESDEARPSSIVISGPELITLNDAQWSQLCEYDEIVFARTTPDQKLRIVRQLQGRDEIVGMTGDGVNDAPSLKAADIGIAMGSGSDIAIEASDMVLLDSFAAMVEAVRYGRTVFDNLKKTIAYLLPAGSFSEFWPVMTNILFGLPQVLSSFLMIIICCFTDCAAATVLCHEAPEADVLLRRPRNPRKDRLVDWRLMLQAYGFIGVIETASSFAMAYWYLQRSGITFSDLWFQFGTVPPNVDPDYYSARLAEASSIYFVNLVVMQWFNLMAVRTRRLSIFQHPPCFNKQTQNLWLFPAIAFALVMAIFWLYIPPLQSVLATSAVPAEHFFLPAAFGVGLLGIDEARKYAVRRWPRGWVAWCAW